MKNIIRFDWAIKRLLRDKANFGILEGLLSELLHDDIKIDAVLESESNKQTAVNKMNRVDLLVQNSKSELIIIEVQSDYTRDFLTRILFGTSKLVVDNMGESMSYDKIKKIISVDIVYFDLGQGNDYVYEGGTSFIGMNTGDKLQLSPREQLIFNAEAIEDVYPKYYLIKVNKFNRLARNTLDEWIDFLKTGKVKKNTKAKGLKEAEKKMDVLKLSPEDRAAYESDLDAWRDYVSHANAKFMDGEEKGLAKGLAMGEANKEQYAEEKAEERAKNERIEMAKKCIKKGMLLADIAELTGLSEEEVRNIEENVKQS